MKKNILIMISLLVILLAACSGSPTSTPSSATDLPASVPTYPGPDSVYPVPDSSYPAPGEIGSGVGGGSVLYPDLQTGAQIEWLPAFSMILNGEVSQVNQAANLQVTLMLKDGRSFITTAPGPSDLEVIVQNCGTLCQGLDVTIE